MAASALQWWEDAGVDCLIGETPRNWLAEKPTAPAGTRPAPAAPDPIDAQSPFPGQLDLFRAWLRDEPTLPYAAPDAPRLCPEGDPTAGLMLMIDMPAAADCAAGRLLADADGRLLDRMLAAIGRDRAAIYLAALSCLRAPDGRFSAAAAARCADIARHHIGLAAPRALLLLGDASAKALLGGAVSQVRGRWHDLETPSGPVRTLATFSPAFLLRQPVAKALAWADLQLLIKDFEVKGPTP